MSDHTISQPSMEPSLPRRQSFTHAWHHIIFHQPGGAQPCLLHVTAHHIHTIAAAQTAIDHQPSSQCRQASWVPPRQGRQPPSGRCALGLPSPSRLPPRCCRLPACASAWPLGRSCLFLPWPAPGRHAPTGGPSVRPPAVLAASLSATASIS